MEIWMHQLLEWLALPQFGLSTVFVVAFISATLLPLGSEPAVFGLIKINPELFWPAILVATVGNTLGGGVSWWMGLGAHKVVDKARWQCRGSPRAELAWALGPPRLPDELAARGGRPAVCCGRLAQAAVLALPGLYGCGQILPLSGSDERVAVLHARASGDVVARRSHRDQGGNRLSQFTGTVVSTCSVIASSWDCSGWARAHWASSTATSASDAPAPASARWRTRSRSTGKGASNDRMWQGTCTESARARKSARASRSSKVASTITE